MSEAEKFDSQDTNLVDTRSCYHEDTLVQEKNGVLQGNDLIKNTTESFTIEKSLEEKDPTIEKMHKLINEEIKKRDNFNQKIKSMDSDILSIESHILGFIPILYGLVDRSLIQKYLDTPMCISHQPLSFPFFIKNVKYILSVFNIGIPTKYPVKGYKYDGVFYTVGYKSRRMYFKHIHHPVLNDDYIIYHCTTYYESKYLIFDIKTDDGLHIHGDNKKVMVELRQIYNFPIEFGSIEEFFGMTYEEVRRYTKNIFKTG